MPHDGPDLPVGNLARLQNRAGFQPASFARFEEQSKIWLYRRAGGAKPVLNLICIVLTTPVLRPSSPLGVQRRRPVDPAVPGSACRVRSHLKAMRGSDSHQVATCRELGES